MLQWGRTRNLKINKKTNKQKPKMTVNSPGNKSVVWVTEYVVRNRRTLTSCAQVSFAYQNIDPRNAKQILEMLIIRALREECG